MTAGESITADDSTFPAVLADLGVALARLPRHIGRVLLFNDESQNDPLAA